MEDEEGLLSACSHSRGGLRLINTRAREEARAGYQLDDRSQEVPT